jgi:DNA-binding response OmpR family regulator
VVPTPLADSPRLHLQVADVLREQVAETVHLARLPRGDGAGVEALAGLVRRVRETSRALGMGHVERAASRALRGLDTPASAELLQELLEVCTGGVRVAPMLRPIAIVSGGANTESLHRQALLTSASVRVLPDLATLADLLKREELGAAVVPISLLEGAPELPMLRQQLLLVSGREEDMQARLAGARLGAAEYLPEPLDLRLVVQRVRSRMSAWRRRAWRVLVAERTRNRVEDLAAALANEEITTIPAVGGFKLLEAIETTGPDLVVVSAPLDRMPVSDLAAMLRGHHRFGSIPLLFLWEGGMIPAALTGHDVVQGELDVPALRARILAALDDRRRERGIAEVDELTGVLSAAAMLNAADREIALARRRGEPLVAARFELDNPRALEAGGGPMAIATSLRLLAQTMLRAVRETDVVGVVSETGLLLLMPGCSLALARARVAGVRQRYAQRLASGGQPGASSFSLGIAEGIDDVLLGAERQLLLSLGPAGREGAGAEGARGLPSLGAGSRRVGPELD